MICIYAVLRLLNYMVLLTRLFFKTVRVKKKVRRQKKAVDCTVIFHFQSYFHFFI